jgi:hypothetical protein
MAVTPRLAAANPPPRRATTGARTDDPKESVMKRFAYPIAILAVVAFTPLAGAEQMNFKIETQTSDLQIAENGTPSLKETKQLRAVQNAYEVKRAFDLAAKERGRQAIEISCAPANSDWCAKDFVQACANAKGGMSTNPDGGVTCSLPQHQ